MLCSWSCTRSVSAAGTQHQGGCNGQGGPGFGQGACAQHAFGMIPLGALLYHCCCSWIVQRDTPPYASGLSSKCTDQDLACFAGTRARSAWSSEDGRGACDGCGQDCSQLDPSTAYKHCRTLRRIFTHGTRSSGAFRSWHKVINTALCVLSSPYTRSSWRTARFVPCEPYLRAQYVIAMQTRILCITCVIAYEPSALSSFLMVTLLVEVTTAGTRGQGIFRAQS